jgi:hypothetical protein
VKVRAEVIIIGGGSLACPPLFTSAGPKEMFSSSMTSNPWADGNLKFRIFWDSRRASVESDYWNGRGASASSSRPLQA